MTAITQQHLWVVLPVYNEGDTLLTLVDTLAALLHNQPYTLLLVDDGSTDTVIAQLQQQNRQNIHIVQHPQNRGLGEAIKTGLESVTSSSGNDEELVVVMDSDMTHPPALIPVMQEHLQKGFDVIIASRFQPGSVVIGVSSRRVFMSHGASWLFRLFLPIPNVKDYTCGYRMYRMGILKKAFAHYKGEFVTETGFSCMADILIKLAKIGARICEVPITLRYDQKRSLSKMNIGKTIMQSLQLVWRNLLKK